MSRNRKPLVPEARHELDCLKGRLQEVLDPEQAKYKVASNLHIPLKKGYNGDLTAHDSGRIGGQLGGKMVKELIRSAQEKLAAKRNP
ncbi:alpha/beta-type small acid-soluble spore protein [Brevibacillus humidisoli]|uniref:alpha/beta-type small acid-soluble spore protein n=1 Tax=Brevibacillus humidisoli TaxID=2895522 RepID=UPI001E53E2E1|nr:alpha/beta-type small acid-soluble spore protein [Brevibacillus humidisoli]UFJ43059.1 alpha/beta-type small acid-soluble spore protein [Brevibacillus humidisoli]